MAAKVATYATRWDVFVTPAGSTFPSDYVGTITELRIDAYQAICERCPGATGYGVAMPIARSRGVARSRLVRHAQHEHGAAR